MAVASSCPTNLRIANNLCEGRKSYYPTTVWGGCTDTLFGTIKTNDCNKFYNAKDGVSYLTCTDRFAETPTCLITSSYRVCIQQGWNKSNLVPCCS